MLSERFTTSSTVVVNTEEGQWIHADSSDFCFCFIHNEWDTETKKIMAKEFLRANAMSNKVKDAVKKLTGDEVVNGLYLLDVEDMVTAMNTIEGMGQTKDSMDSNKGSGTCTKINGEFFGDILAGLGGDVEPLMSYLTKSMEGVQAETKGSTVTNKFGIMIGLVSLVPQLNIPVTTFQYVYSNETTSTWMVSVNCGSSQRYSYDYTYDVVVFNYDPESKGILYPLLLPTAIVAV